MDKSILIIDDEELVTKSLSKLLGAEGYCVTVAGSYSEALEKIKGCDFDLIISDVRMPGLDGIQTIESIRAYLERSNRKTIPEVLITGYADVDKYEKAIHLKVTDYLYKPFDKSDLLHVIKKATA